MGGERQSVVKGKQLREDKQWGGGIGITPLREMLRRAKEGEKLNLSSWAPASQPTLQTPDEHHPQSRKGKGSMSTVAACW